MLNSEKITNPIVGAIDLMITKRLEEVKFDQTYICSIIDDKNSNNGIYKVNHNSTNFIAYNDNDKHKYKNGDIVRVSIPNGDMSEKKFIVGKYVVDSDTLPITYVSPMDSILNITNNLIKDTNIVNQINGVKTNETIATNEGGQTGIFLYKIDLKDISTRFGRVNDLFDTFYIQADFKTLLSNYNIVSGEYGIRADLWDGTNVKSLYLSSDNMFGDPYSFNIYTQQQEVYSLKNIENIDSITLHLYQNNNFYHNTNGKKVAVEKPDAPNILVTRLNVGFGVHMSNVEDNTLKLYTNKYSWYAKGSEGTTKKNLFLLWYNKDENGKYIGFEDGSFKNADNSNYDELTYLSKVESEQRLTKWLSSTKVPHDETGLTIAANLEEVKPIMDEVGEFIEDELLTCLDEFNKSTQSTKTEIFSKIIGNTTTPDTIHYNLIKYKETVKNLYDYFTGMLERAADIYNEDVTIDGSKVINRENFPSKGSISNYSTYVFIYLDKIIYDATATSSLLSSLLKSLNPDLKDGSGLEISYKGIYDNYAKQLLELQKSLNLKRTNIYTLLFNDKSSRWFEVDLDLYPSLYKDEDYMKKYYKVYVPKTFSEYDNKYCIYWYRYDPNRILNTDYYAYDDGIVDKNWARYLHNPGSDIEKQSCYFEMNAEEMQEEKFIVVLFYNHVKYKSNILTFENRSEVIGSEVESLSNSISIVHSEKSMSSYQLYGVSNYLINKAEASYDRALRVDYYDSNATIKNSRLMDGQVYWYIPNDDTMLDISENNINKYQYTKIDENIDIPQSKYIEAGYTCYYKQITDINDVSFLYRIKDYYSSPRCNNHIKCKIITKNNHEYNAIIYFTFSSYGTSGTDYTITITPIGEQSAVMPDKPLQLALNLYDYNNKAISKSITFSCQLQNITKNYTFVLKDNICTITKVKESQDYYDVLTVTVTQTINNSLVDLKAYYPIAYSTGNYFIEGATTIVYDNNGGNPQYFKEDYKLYDWESKNQIELSNIAITNYGNGYNSTTKTQDVIGAFAPKLEGYQIVPCRMFIDLNDTKITPVVTLTGKNNEKYYQSIYICQNRYPSAMLNSWDGELTIDEKNGTILSTMVGAGRKTANNTFEGVLMGDIQEGADFNPEETKAGIGLYGFHDGAQSFGFNIDGTAFIGKSGRGRIKFNGNEGSITSASYELTQKAAGMKLDLDDGYIHMRGANKTTSGNTNGYEKSLQSEIYLSVLGDPYFKINSKNGNPLIYVGDKNNVSNYFLQTDNFIDSEGFNIYITDINSSKLTTQNGESLYLAALGAGTRIDLANGKITSYDFSLNAFGSQDDWVKLNSAGTDDKPYLQVHHNNKDLLKISENEFVLQSHDYDPKTKSGTQFNVRSGSINSYNFTLNAQNDGKFITLTSNTNEKNKYPLNINNVFTVDWSGALVAQAGTIGKKDYGQLYISNSMSIGNGKVETSGMNGTVSSDTEDNIEDIYLIRSFSSADIRQVSLGTGNNSFYLGPGGLIFKNISNNDEDAVGVRLSSSCLAIEGTKPNDSNDAYGVGLYYGNGIRFFTPSNQAESVLFNAGKLASGYGEISCYNGYLTISAPKISIKASERIFIDTADKEDLKLEVPNIKISGTAIITNLVVESSTQLNSLTVNDSATLNSLTVNNSTTLNSLTINNSASLNSLTVTNSTTLNSLTVNNSTTLNSLTVNNVDADTVDAKYLNKNGSTVATENYVDAKIKILEKYVDTKVQEAYDKGYSTGYTLGESAGYSDGYEDGESAGYSDGYEEGESYGYGTGYNNGYDAGYERGYDKGYDKGYEAGSSSNSGGSSGGSDSGGSGSGSGTTPGSGESTEIK